MSEVALVERQKKELESIVNTVVMQQPSLKDKLTVPIIWNYMQMPDSTFGWNAGGEMPKHMKVALVAAHLQHGAQLGFGHIYYLGNKMYQSAEFVRSKAANDPEWKVVGNPTFKPHTVEERLMYGLTEGDMSCKVECEVEYKGKKFLASGDGFIGKDEINYRSSGGKSKAGMDTIKNRAMTLKTRAMRDLYNRYYPTQGLPVAPEHGEDTPEYQDAQYVEQVKIVNETSTEEARSEYREKIKSTQEDSAKKEEKKKLLELLEKIKEAAKANGVSSKDLWASVNCKTQAEFTAMPNETIADSLEIMSEFITTKAKPDTFDAEVVTEQKEIKKEKPSEDKKLLTAALKMYETTIGSVQGMGGLPMKILGFNHMNVFDWDDVKAIQTETKRLEKWIGEKVRELAEKDPFSETVLSIEQDEVSLKQLKALLENPKLTDDGVKIRLQSLLKCKLVAGDHELILNAARVGQIDKNYSGLDKLISRK